MPFDLPTALYLGLLLGLVTVAPAHSRVAFFLTLLSLFVVRSLFFPDLPQLVAVVVMGVLVLIALFLRFRGRPGNQ